jgi:hypothetical protein
MHKLKKDENLKNLILKKENKTEKKRAKRPILFNKKSNKTIIKAIKYRENDTGFTRHFTPAAQEWHNSICSYNYTYYKSLPVADKNLFSLLKSYFNLHFKPKVKKIKVIKRKQKNKRRKIPEKNKQGTRSLPIRYRKLSVNKTFIGKGNIKHTSNRIVLTFYVYDLAKMVLEAKAKFYKRLSWKIIFAKLWFKNGQRHFPFYNNYLKRLVYDKGIPAFDRESLLGWPDHISWLTPRIELYRHTLPLFVDIMPLEEKKTKIKKKESKIKWKIVDLKRRISFEKKFMKVTQRVKIIEWLKKETWKALLIDNNLSIKQLKLKSPLIYKLIYFIEKLYHKKVELNIVHLKKMHYNSDIFTQAVSLKLKNRDNKLYRVLKASLRKVKLWPIDKIVERQKKRDKEKILTNKIRNNIISYMFVDQEVKDPLSRLLIEFFPPAVSGESIMIKGVSAFINHTFFFPLKDYILSSLKHNKLRGIRVEAKGRLTRRLTASRSVFKMKWKGGLKNVDSTFRGFPAIMLRGHVKSNVQYTIINSKTRNGAYGVKGWVSSR